MITLGTDPELFLVDRRTNALIPACGKIGGTKGNALDLGDGFGLQEDNVMVEFNTPPTGDPTQFLESVQTGLRKTMDFVRTKIPEVDYDTGSERVFMYGLLDTPGARVFGCSPDFDAYNHGEPHNALDPGHLDTDIGAWRFAGGHVHIGFHPNENVPKFVAASFADLFLGLRSIGEDNQPERRKLYGQPGRYRPTSYGIEYRTLSNYWIFQENYAYETGCRAFNLAMFLEETSPDRLREKFKAVPWNDVRRAITTDDTKLSQSLMSYCRNEVGIGGI